MANLRWPRAEARGRFNARSRRWRWLGRAPPVRTRVEKMATMFLQRKYYPRASPRCLPLGNLQRIRLRKMCSRRVKSYTIDG